MNRSAGRRWLINALGILIILLLLWSCAAFRLSSAAASSLAFPIKLRSQISADYSANRLERPIRSVRFSIVEDTLRDVGLAPEEAEEAQAAFELAMLSPVPTATPAPGQLPPLFTPSSTPVSTGTRSPSRTPTEPIPETATTAIGSSPTKSKTPTGSPAPTDTPSGPSQTPTKTPTKTKTPATTATPECSKIYYTAMWGGNDWIRAKVKNDNTIAASLTTTHFEWPQVSGSKNDWFGFGGNEYWPGNDYDSPTDVGGTNVALPGGAEKLWENDFDEYPPEGIWGDFTLQLTFAFPGWPVTCTITRSISIPPPATKTPTTTATMTATPTVPPAPSDTPAPTPIPTSVCSSITLTGFSTSGKDARWTVKNVDSTPITINAIDLTWPTSNGKLKLVKLDGATISSPMADPPSTSIIVSFALSPSQSKELKFEFENDAQATGYGLTVTYDGGCSVSDSQ